MSSHRFPSLTDALLSAWKDGRHVSEWSHLAPLPLNRGEGYAAQAAFCEATGQPTMGWKIAATSTAGQQHINVSGPLAGRLLASRCHPASAKIVLGNNRMRVMEPEFAFRIGQDILAGAGTSLGLQEVMACVKDLHLAIEIPDSRFEHFLQAGEALLLADFACAHQLVLGPAVSHDWRRLDLSQHAVQVKNHGQLKAQGSGANVLGDPRFALTWLANELINHGMYLREGETVITGTCVVPVLIDAGDAIEADFGVLGTVSMQVA
jgi:2-keto-4-pentenoate hydratase